MKTFKYITLIFLSIILVLLVQNVRMRKMLKIANDIANESVRINSSSLDYILEHFENEVADSTRMFIQCANEVRENNCISKEQKYLLQKYASSTFWEDCDVAALRWSLKKSLLGSPRFLVLTILENDIINMEKEDFFAIHTFVHNGGHVLNISPKDTLRYGESYIADMKFVLEDSCNNGMYMVSNDKIWTEEDLERINNDTLKNGHYQTIVQKKGENIVYGLYRIDSYGGTRFYPFQLNYYVK